MSDAGADGGLCGDDAARAQRGREPTAAAEGVDRSPAERRATSFAAAWQGRLFRENGRHVSRWVHLGVRMVTPPIMFVISAGPEMVTPPII